MEKTQVENAYVKIWIEDEILFMSYKKPQIDLEYAKIAVETRTKLCNNAWFPVFVDLNNVKSVSKEARGYLGGKEAANLITASALWGISDIVRMLSNFYLAINKPDVPVRFFSDKEKAVEWLQNHRMSLFDKNQKKVISLL